MLKEIQANTASNILKVSEQEIPQFSKEKKEVQKLTAEALIDCAIDPHLGDLIMGLLPA